MLSVKNTRTNKDEMMEVKRGHKYRVAYYHPDKERPVEGVGICYDVADDSFYLQCVTADTENQYFWVDSEDLNEVVTVKRVQVPLNNIYRIEDLSLQPIPGPAPEEKERTVYSVATLGISAEVIQAIIVKLRVYDDMYMDAETTPIEMKVGCDYHIEYIDKDHRGRINVIDATLLDIQYDRASHDAPDDGYVREEIVGAGNKIYNADNFFTLDKNTDVSHRVILFMGNGGVMDHYTTTVRLTDIRFVSELKDLEEDPGQPIPPKPPKPPKPEENDELIQDQYYDSLMDKNVTTLPETGQSYPTIVPPPPPPHHNRPPMDNYDEDNGELASMWDD